MIYSFENYNNLKIVNLLQNKGDIHLNAKKNIRIHKKKKLKRYSDMYIYVYDLPLQKKP